ncbi:olfactory receptor 52K2-like [Pelodiscus sinensis]|uniref:olfactory receptor 52K2-like n=1 Tax=Pelodiscus sinensis TaxID=13735 RepID=UPI003F6AE35F
MYWRMYKNLMRQHIRVPERLEETMAKWMWAKAQCHDQFLDELVQQQTASCATIWEAMAIPGNMSLSDTNLQIDYAMAGFNLTPSDESTFILTGIPGLENTYVWIAIIFAMSYIITMLGNVTVLLVIGKDQTLHKPMYLLICMLALTDIAKSTSTLPKALCIFWFNLKSIIVGACITQTFFLNTIGFTQSAILVAMAFDRYVAICNPLRYTTILTNARIAVLGLTSFIRSVLFMLPLPLFLSKLSFCANRTIAHTHCENMAVAKLSCGDITVSSMYSLVVSFVVSGLDLMLIALSYGLIIRAVLRISSRKAHQKAFKTCTAHISVMLTIYTPGYLNSLTLRFVQGIAPHIQVIVANIYLLIPPMLNPIIYGVKTKELRDKMRKCSCRM